MFTKETSSKRLFCTLRESMCNAYTLDISTLTLWQFIMEQPSLQQSWSPECITESVCTASWQPGMVCSDMLMLLELDSAAAITIAPPTYANDWAVYASSAINTKKRRICWVNEAFTIWIRLGKLTSTAFKIPPFHFDSIAYWSLDLIFNYLYAIKIICSWKMLPRLSFLPLVHIQLIAYPIDYRKRLQYYQHARINLWCRPRLHLKSHPVALTLYDRK